MPKAIEEASYYEVLEVQVSASGEEIQRAYEKLLAIFDTDSIVGYTLLDPESAARHKESLEKAYNTLIDPIARREYDRRNDKGQANKGNDGQAQAEIPVIASAQAEGAQRDMEQVLAPVASLPEVSVSKPPASASVNSASQLERPKHALQHVAGVASSSERAIIVEGAVYDGFELTRVRASLGISLNEIAEHTKISKHYLMAIEENRWHNMPAEVYLRGFLRQYAQYLGLDGKQVVDSYMRLYKANILNKGKGTL